jgi:septum formation protein
MSTGNGRVPNEPIAMTIWCGKHPLILASQSRTRQMLLANAGIACKAVPAAIDERALQEASRLSEPGAIASLLAREKALAVSAKNPGHFVVGADQTLALGMRLFNKPAGRVQALEQLQALAGNTHELHSAVAVVCDGNPVFADIAVARMTMRRMGEGELAAYLDAAGDQVTSSVGAYQLEGLGVHLFERVEGDHFTILGLPLLSLLAFLRGQGMFGV